jgi:hypothetical protein
MFKSCLFVHFEVLVIDKNRYRENMFPRDVKFCPRMGYISCGFLWPVWRSPSFDLSQNISLQNRSPGHGATAGGGEECGKARPDG